MTNTKRTPAGVPTGGEFAANEHDEASASLDGFLFTGGDEDVIESGEGSWESGGRIAIELNDGSEITVDTGSNHPTYIDPKYEALADGTIRVTFAVPEEGLEDYEWEEAGAELREQFDTQDERNEFIDQKLAEGYAPEQIHLAFMFTNGGTSAHESRGTAADENWRDEGNSVGVLVVGDPGEEGDFIERGKSTMTQYTQWQNGDVYGISTVHRTRTGEPVPGRPSETYWGVIGHEHAEEEVRIS